MGKQIYPVLQQTIDSVLDFKDLSPVHKQSADTLALYLQNKMDCNQPIAINFICTHNSRRSQLCQVWMHLALYYYGFESLNCYSGGTQVTEFNSFLVQALQSQGFVFDYQPGKKNPVYFLRYNPMSLPIVGFSKLYNSAYNPSQDFIAVMTCDQASNDCPLVLKADFRLPMLFLDPKRYDNQSDVLKHYHDASQDIARVMFYVVSQLKK